MGMTRDRWVTSSRTVLDGLENAALMAYEVWWALVLGFAISAVVQAWVPRPAGRGGALRERLRPGLQRRPDWARLPPRAPTPRSRSPSRCSQKGASAATALAFQFASTNLVWELGLVLWVLIGWQFTLAEFVGGLVLIAPDGARCSGSSSRRGSRSTPAATPESATSRPRAPRGGSDEDGSWRERLTLRDGLVGRRPQLPRRLADAVEGDHDRLPARRVHRAARRRLLQRAVRDRRPGRRSAR